MKRNLKQKLKRNRGITLIALVITIIILLILAGVSLSLVFNSDGLFSKANEAATRWNNSKEEEADELQRLTDLLDTSKITVTSKKTPMKFREDIIAVDIEIGVKGFEQYEKLIGEEEYINYIKPLIKKKTYEEKEIIFDKIVKASGVYASSKELFQQAGAKDLNEFSTIMEEDTNFREYLNKYNLNAIDGLIVELQYDLFEKTAYDYIIDIPVNIEKADGYKITTIEVCNYEINSDDNLEKNQDGTFKTKENGTYMFTVTSYKTGEKIKKTVVVDEISSNLQLGSDYEAIGRYYNSGEYITGTSGEGAMVSVALGNKATGKLDEFNEAHIVYNENVVDISSYITKIHYAEEFEHLRV